jgi:transposase-like protein
MANSWWTPEREQAVQLVFEGRLRQPQIAERCRISERTLRYWIDNPEFQQRLESLRTDITKSAVYADKLRRILALDQMAESARQAYEERTWIKEVRPTPQGGFATNERYNSEAFREFRGALDDIAKELGHRVNKSSHEVSGPGGKAIPVQSVDYSAVIASIAPGPEEDSEPSGEG